MEAIHLDVRSSTMQYWRECALIDDTGPKELSTTLLITPEYHMANLEGFELFCGCLTESLTSLKCEDQLQLVFFHPNWVFRDGAERSGEAASANFARRSPFPMINLLRTPQVRAAQRAIPTGAVYAQNEKTLASVGVGCVRCGIGLGGGSSGSILERMCSRGGA